MGLEFTKDEKKNAGNALLACLRSQDSAEQCVSTGHVKTLKARYCVGVLVKAKVFFSCKEKGNKAFL